MASETTGKYLHLSDFEGNQSAMTKLQIATLLSLTLMASQAHTKEAEANIEYVGGGRYSCRGDSFKCVQIEQQNRAESERQRREYQREQDRAQDYVDRERRRYEEQRNRR